MSISPSSSAAARNFSRAAASYREWAAPQREAAERLVALLPPEICPARCIDMGCGTGFLTQALRARFPNASLQGLDIAPGMISECRRQFQGDSLAKFDTADARVYTVTDVDLVASSFMAQWLPSPGMIAAGWVSRGGWLALAVPVRGSLMHLREAHQEALGRPFGGLQLPLAGDIRTDVSRSGARIVHESTESVGYFAQDGLAALRVFHAIGAGAGGHDGYTPLTPREVRRLADVYTRRHHVPGRGVPVEYTVHFLIAEGSI